MLQDVVGASISQLYRKMMIDYCVTQQNSSPVDCYRMLMRGLDNNYEARHRAVANYRGSI